jgi:hypothetical protein
VTTRDTYDIEQAEAENHVLQVEEIARRARSEAYMTPYVERFREIAKWHAQLQVEFDRSLLRIEPETF